jgi:dTDP-4-dehydrorhamnose reductase
MKILITGASGMLGIAYQNLFQGTAVTVYAASHDQLDIRSSETPQLIASFFPDIIIHCAAYTSVDKAETEREVCLAVNIEGSRNVARAAAKCDALLIYNQTFLTLKHGTNLQSEDSQKGPISHYASTKLQGEMAVASEWGKVLTVCKGGLFGGVARDKNFVGKIISYLRSQKPGSEVNIGNRVWQPTWTEDVACWTTRLALANFTGTFNLASSGSASFYETASFIANYLRIPVEMKEVDWRTVATREIAQRPECVLLNCQKAEKALGLTIPTWQERLEEYLYAFK